MPSAVIRRSLLLSVLLLAGCAMHGTSLATLPAEEWRGHYAASDKASWFRPCGAVASDSSWWVTITGDAVEQMSRARLSGQFRQGVEYFVRWNAAKTTSGEVGPRGPGKPALLVRNVLELRAASDSDCAGGTR